jgi:hypothetical protein
MFRGTPCSLQYGRWGQRGPSKRSEHSREGSASTANHRESLKSLMICCLTFPVCTMSPASEMVNCVYTQVVWKLPGRDFSTRKFFVYKQKHTERRNLGHNCQYSTLHHFVTRTQSARISVAKSEVIADKFGLTSPLI